MGLTPKAVAERVGLPVDELARLRGVDDGPPWMVLPRGLIRYDDAEVDQWVDDQDRPPGAA